MPRTPVRPGPAGPPDPLDGAPGAGRNLLDEHLAHLAAALLPYRQSAGLLARWGVDLARHLGLGGRLLVAGNGGSAAEAQHLTAELVGKLRDDREPLSAIALHAETSAVTAIANDYGYEQAFARQVRAHGRPGDVLLLMSTSGSSPNLITAARAGRDTGLRCWAFTGPTPNPLADACHETLAIDSPDSQVVQELHLVSTHLLCEYVDRALPAVRAARSGLLAVGDTAPPDTAPATGAAGPGPVGAAAVPVGLTPGAAAEPAGGAPGRTGVPLGAEDEPAGAGGAGPVRTGVEVVVEGRPADRDPRPADRGARRRRP
ncbi:D-sedoheptulose-7-phosphate isomerase [Micromonospora fluostatini]|uniref:D-sedoheptulose-7-phosphate isomerase n=1 Tax=Micromonospora sp. JCM 30529 TaxID=3421643 RepID=UPI003D183D26